MSPRPVFFVLSAILGFWGASSFLSEPQAKELRAPSASPNATAESKPQVRITRQSLPVPSDPVVEAVEEPERVDDSIEDEIDMALNNIEDAGLEGGVLVVRVVDSFQQDIQDAALSTQGCKTDLSSGAYEGVDSFGSYHPVNGRPLLLPLAPGICNVTASRGAGLLRIESPPESVRIESGEVTRVTIELEEERGGLGFQLGFAEGGIHVVGIYRDTPAWDTDLQVGDVVTKIDGQSTAEMSLEEFASLGTGPIGEEVRLVVRREMEGSSGVLMKGIILEREYLAEDLSIGDGLHYHD